MNHNIDDNSVNTQVYCIEVNHAVGQLFHIEEGILYSYDGLHVWVYNHERESILRYEIGKCFLRKEDAEYFIDMATIMES